MKLEKTMKRIISIAICAFIFLGCINVMPNNNVSLTAKADSVFKSYALSETEIKKIASLCQQEQGTAKGAAAEASLMANRFELYGSKYSSVYDYARNSGWFAKAGTHMDKMNATDAVVAAVRSVLIDGKRTIPGYIDEHDCFSDLSSCTNNGKSITITNRSQYQQFVTIIKNKYGSTYTFYCFPTNSSDPFGYISQANRNRIGDAYYDYDTGDLVNAPNDDKVETYNPEGYIDTAEGGAGTVTVTGWAVDRDSINESIDVHIYMDGPSGQGGTYIGAVKADQPSPDVASVMGYSGNHRFTATFNIDAVGSHTFYAHGINIGGGDTNSLLNNSCETYILERTNSIISNVFISQVTPSGYTVNIAVSDESKVGRIAVPVWTTHKAAEHGNYESGQDDLLSGWESLSIAKKIGTNTYVFDVNIEDHNSESGEYCNDVYVYGKDGSQLDRWCKETGHRTYANVPSEKVIISVAPYDITPSGYMLNIKVADDSKIGKIAVPVWTTYYSEENNHYEQGQDDLLSGWQDRSIAKQIGTNNYKFAVSTLDHNNESGEYNNDIYVYDKDGNMIDRWCLETKHRTYVNVPAEKMIRDVTISNVTPYGYDVIITVADESKVGRIAVPVWTSYYSAEHNNYQDDLNPAWQIQCIAKKSDKNNYVYHVDISEHNNESGEYCNDVYVYGKDGNMVDRWSRETSHRVYVYVPEKISGDANVDGEVNIADLVMLQKWLLTESNELTCWQNVDLCKDGVIDVFDMVMLRRILIKKK